jgi:hypothetical protein
MSIDNDHDDFVVAFLGDLGEYLPEGERTYWRAFNVPPQGGMSETSFRRAILAQFAASKSVDLRFRKSYREILRRWPERFGWTLFREPERGDTQLLATIRRTLHNSDSEFEDIVRTLAKLLVDSLNEEALVKESGKGERDEKGITKFDRWLRHASYPEAARDIGFLRTLQEVRSKGAAHRKGADYERTLDRAFGTKRRSAAADDLLQRAVLMLDGLIDFASREHGPA